MTMGSDTSTKDQPPASGAIGSGHMCNYKCAACVKQFGSTMGSGLRFVMGGKQRVCPDCKARIDKRRGIV